MRADILPFPDTNEPWSVHEDPERPLDGYALICGCITCRRVLVELPRRDPRALIAIKTGGDRLLVTSDLVSETLLADDSLSSLLYIEDDSIRGLFTPADGRLPAPQRWWSSRCAADDHAAGEVRRRYRVARRQSRARRRREEAAWAEASPESPQVARLVELAVAVRPMRAKYKVLISAVATWALRERRSLCLDRLALILAGTDAHFGHEGSVSRWSRTGVNEVMSVGLPNWCSQRRTLIPDGVPETLWTYLDFLFDTARLDPASDPLRELRKPLRCYCGLDEHGRSGSPPPERREPCECYVAYRGAEDQEHRDAMNVVTPVRRRSAPVQP